MYAFHVLFVSILCWLFLKAVVAQAEGRVRDFSWLSQLFALCLGLSFANHMMTVLLAPAFLYLCFAVNGWSRRAGIAIAKVVPLFLAGLIPYLYLPVRASEAPLMNWGDPSTLGGLWRHLNAHTFRYQMFRSFENALQKLGGFFTAFPREFGHAPVILVVAGFVLLAKRSRRLFVFAGLLFLTCLFYTINYGFEDPNY